MTELEIIKWIVVGLMGVGVWFMRRTIENAEKDIRDLHNTVDGIKQDYLHKNDFKEFKIELRGMFEEIKKDLRSLNRHG